jgi:shikimate kinase
MTMEPIILIGPINAGKSTVAELLAERLSMPLYSLDAEAQQYAVPLGYDIEQYNSMKEENLVAAYEYRRGFYDDLVMQFLKAHDQGILDFGAGHPVVSDPRKQQRINDALKPYQNIFLLMPMPDVQESLAILRQRNAVTPGQTDLNELYFKNGNKTFWEIAKHVVYTEGKTPAQTCEEIVKQL